MGGPQHGPPLYIHHHGDGTMKKETKDENKKLRNKK